MAAEDYFDFYDWSRMDDQVEDGPDPRLACSWEEKHAILNPNCRGKRVTRTNRETKEQFYGCSMWPTCKVTFSLPKPKPKESTLDFGY